MGEVGETLHGKKPHQQVISKVTILRAKDEGRCESVGTLKWV